MKILVAVKRVIDPYTKIRVKPDKTGVETHNVKMTINPFDEIALEEALRLQEQKQAEEVIAVSIGRQDSQETLRHALALGADRAILICSEHQHCSLNIAKILQKIVVDEQVQLVLMGKQSIDGDNNQTAQMLAALLDWPQATFASELRMTAGGIEVVREIDAGLETLAMQLPAVVSADLRLNTPRYATLPNIMKAKHKPLTSISLNDLGLKLKEHARLLEVKEPITHSNHVRLTSVAELLNTLQHEAKVLELRED